MWRGKGLFDLLRQLLRRVRRLLDRLLLLRCRRNRIQRSSCLW